MLGATVYRLRTEKGLSQSELGELVGVSNKAVSKWETDETNPDICIVPRLAEVLGVTTDELLTDIKAEEKDAASPRDARLFFVRGTEVNTPEKYEFISDRKTKKGTPYVHIHIGKTLAETFKGNARGLIAVGFRARGLLTFGFISMGVLSFGFIGIGLLAFGVFTLGLIGFGGIIAAGGIVFAPVATGFIAFGLVAVGYVSNGELVSIGYYANSGIRGLVIGKKIGIWGWL